MRLRAALLLSLPLLGSGLAAADEPYEGIRIAPGRPGGAPGATEGQSPAKSADQARSLGAKWLEQHQNGDGGWAAGGWGGVEAGSDVATTVIAVQALQRDDRAGHQAAIRKGIEFVLKAVESAPKQGPLLNTPRNTQPQYKLGPNVDTHLAAKLLGDVANDYSGAEKARVLGALDVALVKAQAAQDANGAYESSGWAPALSSSFATQGLARGKELGREVVKDESIARNDDWQRKQLQGQSFDASAGAGVELYAVATGLANATAASGRGEGKAMAPVADAAAARVSRGDAGFVSGYGSLGGEEVLSYGMIGDSLRKTDLQKAKDWDGKMGEYLMRVQNGDGSWSGHHCITSTPFTTAAAVMTLGAERTSGPSAMRPVEKPIGNDTWWATVE